MADPKVSIILEVINKASPELKKLQSGIEDAASSLKGLGGSGSTALVGMKALTIGFAAVATAALAAGTALVKMGLDSAEMADALGETAARAQMSVEGYQTLDVAAKQAGSSAKELIDSAEQLGVKLAKQDEESGKAAEALARLGISTKNANGDMKSLLQIQTEIVKAAAKAPDAARAQGDAIILLGKNYNTLGGTILEVDGKQRDLYDRMQRTGQLVTEDMVKKSSDLTDQIGYLGGAFTGMATSIGQAVVPMLTEVVKWIVDVSEKAAEVIRKFTNPTEIDSIEKRITKLNLRMESAVLAGKDFTRVLQGAYLLGTASKTGKLETIDEIIERTKQELALAEEDLKVAKERQRIAKEAAINTGAKATAGAGMTEAEKRAAEAKEEARREKLERERKAREEKAAREKEALAKRVFDSEKAYADAIDKALEERETVQREAALKERKDQEEITKEWQKKADVIRDSLDPFRELQRVLDEINSNPILTATEKLEAASIATDKWAESLDRTKTKVTELDQFIVAAAQSMQQSMSDFFFDIMQGNITNLVDSFKKAIDRMVADMLAAKAAMALFGDYGTTGKIGGAAGMAGTFLSGLFRADGGPVTAGKPYIVGERGPETFIPRSSGTIMSNADTMSGYSGGGGKALTVNINAIDAKSVLAQMDSIKRPLAEMMLGTQRTYNMRTA